MHPFLFYTLFLFLTPLYIAFLVSFIFMPQDLITKTLQSLSFFFKPLRIILLTPGVASGHFVSKTHWFKKGHELGSADRVNLILGGNKMTPYESYDCIYSRLIQEDAQDHDCACIPLQTFLSEKEYINDLVQRCKDEILVGKREINIYGHSLGGALSIQLAYRLSQIYPDLKINLFISRSFDKLWLVSRFKYGSMIGGFFEKIFSGLWSLDSQRTLALLPRDRTKIYIEQAMPDEILGKALLQPSDLGNETFDSYNLEGTLSPELLHSISQAHLESLRQSGVLVKSTQ